MNALKKGTTALAPRPTPSTPKTVSLNLGRLFSSISHIYHISPKHNEAEYQPAFRTRQSDVPTSRPHEAKRCANAPHEQSAVPASRPHEAKPMCQRPARGKADVPTQQLPLKATNGDTRPPLRGRSGDARSAPLRATSERGAHAEVGGDRPEFTSGRSGGWDSPP